MAAPSSDFETADYPELRACSLAARGLWADMRYLMRHSSRFGYLYQAGKPMSLRQLALTTGCPTDEAPQLVQELTEAGVCVRSETEGYYSPRMVAYESFRAKCGAGGRKGGGNPKLKAADPDAPTFKGSPKGCPKGSTDDAEMLKGCDSTFKGSPKGSPAGPPPPPPMVSPPITPSSLSPPILSSGGEVERTPVVPSALRQAALQAFDLWSQKSRGRPLLPEMNEHQPVFDLLEIVMQDPPIARGREVIPRQNLVPQAAEHCRLNLREFKHAKYAASTVRGILAEWAVKGVPGADAGQPRQYRPTGTAAPDRSPIQKTFTRDI